MKELEFKVTIEEANLILEGVGQLPFARVYALVAKLQDQAGRQLHGERTAIDDGGGAGTAEDAARPGMRVVEE